MMRRSRRTRGLPLCPWMRGERFACVDSSLRLLVIILFGVGVHDDVFITEMCHKCCRRITQLPKNLVSVCDTWGYLQCEACGNF